MSSSISSKSSETSSTLRLDGDGGEEDNVILESSIDQLFEESRCNDDEVVAVAAAAVLAVDASVGKIRLLMLLFKVGLDFDIQFHLIDPSSGLFPSSSLYIDTGSDSRIERKTLVLRLVSAETNIDDDRWWLELEEVAVEAIMMLTAIVTDDTADRAVAHPVC